MHSSSLANKLKPRLSSLECLVRQTSIRWYRFDNRVQPKGFYCAADYEKNRQFLKSDCKLSAEELRLKRNKLFDLEKKRQSDLVTRIEKITVSVVNPYGNTDESETINLLMNKDISTPYHCSQHIDQMITNRSVVALIDDKTYWDIHRPLVSDCQLRFKHFKEPNPYFANKTYWKSCSLLMGSAIEQAFKDTIDIKLHSWPKPDLNSGSFVYDVYIDLKDWVPKTEELRVFTAMLQKLTLEDIPFERLDVNKELAKVMFEHNSIKSQQIDSMADTNGSDSVTVYRVKDHLDISCGPLIANTSQVGSIHVTAVHQIASHLGSIYRFQGISVPKQLNINSYTFSILRERAAKRNASKFMDISDTKDSQQISEQKSQQNDSKVRQSVNQ
ncbi:39S ribosomal protein L39, mitochondrial-like [Oppia nitens]|uniref:39S ribosomal protein L39, mitochondrial-like n=1 Tax=Oppia nitens TaxID=1686743 RepID=UPI0023DB2C91|nr:39S ribosomal protein L39, mitochondrial-like [Oppia nitens]